MTTDRSSTPSWTSLAVAFTAVVLAASACSKDATEEVAEEAVAPATEAVPGPPLDTSTLPAVVASVNGEEIAKETLLQKAAEQRAMLTQRGAPPAVEDATFYRGVLDHMVGAMLLYEEAGRQGFQVSENDVNSQVEAIRSGFPDEQSFIDALSSRSTSPEQLADSIRLDLSIGQLIDRSIATTVQVTDEQKQAFYDEHIDQMKQPEKVRVRHILIAVPPDATPEVKAEALTRVTDLRQQIRDGADFAELAKQHSADTGSARLGGELPWIFPGQMVPPFERAAYELEQGALSEPVETRFGYHLIEKLGREDATVLPFDQVQGRIGEMLHGQEVQAQIESLIENLRGQAQIEIFM